MTKKKPGNLHCGRFYVMWLCHIHVVMKNMPILEITVTWNHHCTWSDNKVRELIAVKVVHTSLLNTTVVAFNVLPLGNYTPMPTPCPPFKQFWNWFCGMAFRAAVVLLLMSSKCLPFNISFIFGNRKKSLGAISGEWAGCSNTVICLVAKNSSLLLFLGELLWDHFCTHLPHVKIFSYDFPVFCRCSLALLCS